jgi:hypothetical protein
LIGRVNRFFVVAQIWKSACVRNGEEAVGIVESDAGVALAKVEAWSRADRLPIGWQSRGSRLWRSLLRHRASSHLSSLQSSVVLLFVPLVPASPRQKHFADQQLCALWRASSPGAARYQFRVSLEGKIRLWAPFFGRRHHQPTHDTLAQRPVGQRPAFTIARIAIACPAQAILVPLRHSYCKLSVGRSVSQSVVCRRGRANEPEPEPEEAAHGFHARFSITHGPVPITRHRREYAAVPWLTAAFIELHFSRRSWRRARRRQSVGVGRSVRLLPPAS